MIISRPSSKISELSLPDISENDIRSNTKDILDLLLVDRVVSSLKKRIILYGRMTSFNNTRLLPMQRQHK